MQGDRFHQQDENDYAVKSRRSAFSVVAIDIGIRGRDFFPAQEAIVK